MFKIINLYISVTILPIIFSFLIFYQIRLMNKDKIEYKLSQGQVESFGFTNKVRVGNHRTPTTSVNVLFLKLNKNDTIYSFFLRNKSGYENIIKDLKPNMFVKIFHEGYDNKQNTVDIIQLENVDRILINKDITDKRNYIMLGLFSSFLFFSLFIPYKFIYLESKKNNNRKYSH